jgi:hypothetical protein
MNRKVSHWRSLKTRVMQLLPLLVDGLPCWIRRSQLSSAPLAAKSLATLQASETDEQLRIAAAAATRRIHSAGRRNRLDPAARPLGSGNCLQAVGDMGGRT